MFVFLQVTLMTLESSKMSTLLGALDLNVGQKTVIVANSAQEVDDVYKVKLESAFQVQCNVLAVVEQTVTKR